MSEPYYTVYAAPNGYTVGLDFTGHIVDGKCQMDYYLADRDGNRIFEGRDFYPAPSISCDSSEAATHLLAFLTLKPGDTDDEYFEDYTPEQLAWVESADCEELAYFQMDEEEGGPTGWVERE